MSGCDKLSSKLIDNLLKNKGFKLYYLLDFTAKL
jgi:hypothetical protein